ncbi:murein DD-endopeptidase MepM/ murein hydrolase activator NlpD [Panacagrimonas perspica]|uniref:Murein DD-endopeptidase MepM/ murein hydrolase activator NlpD n=1 Tax=Panacagrimonas perspica TaxID=381431 RepID=A0A4R7P3C4_9GAMM|nr:murein DD-endopeptidase MepM/ murein hydrolase activator NlpD [Panacagrimonas perspica]
MKLDYSSVDRSPRSARRIVLAASVCVVGLAILVSRESIAKRDLSTPSFSEDVAIAEAVAYEQAIQSAVSDPLVVPEASEWSSVRIEPGETLSTVFETEGLDTAQWMSILELGPDARQLKRIKAGDTLEIRKSGDDLLELRYELDDLRTLHVERVGDHFEANTLTADLARSTRTITGTIDSSLFIAGQKAGLPVRMVMELAELFRYDIDFALDLRDGDRFTVVMEELYKDGVKLRDGDMLAAEFVNQGKVHRAVRFKDGEGRSAFYTPDGQSLRKAFFRTPLDVVRVSSPFNLRRRHPILNTIRAHKGVDYAASSGTPIKATGDGKVAFIGNKGGYGRVVILQHGQQYETLYAHMSRFRAGMKAGAKVKQGQVIGYVGASGLATAPHLHYEFRVNGVHKNPVNIVMPRANPIARAQLPKFQSQIVPLIAQIESARAPRVAQAPAAILPAISAATP